MHVHDHRPLDELQFLAKAITQQRVWLRYQAIIHAIQGDTAADIARTLGWSERAVQGWVARDNRGGPHALDERPPTGRPARLTGPELLRCEQRREAGPKPEDGLCTFHGRDLQRILEQEFGVLLGLQAVSDRRHRLGFSSLRPRPQHKDADQELQEIFKEFVVAQSEAIREAHPDEEVQVWFEDEARFGQHGTLTRVGAKRGARPRAVRPTHSTSLDVLTAVCVSTGAASALVIPELNTAVLNRFLKQFARELPAGVHAVLLWDGAGYPTSGDLKVPKNVSLIQLVPSSPELNPVENLWHYLRSHHWSIRVYGDYAAWEDEAVRRLCAVCSDAEQLKSIGAASYLHECA